MSSTRMRKWNYVFCIYFIYSEIFAERNSLSEWFYRKFCIFCISRSDIFFISVLSRFVPRSKPNDQNLGSATWHLCTVCPKQNDQEAQQATHQRSARILVLARSRENWLRFFSLDLEKFNLCFSFSSRNMRITISNLDLVSKHENNKTKISISSRKIAPSSIFLMIF